ncbi:ribosome biogenesis protein NOP53-like [Argiope bruennichi]|uniref:ribosome biogenesis protein NOP53-like n=1 Tax=Argiope bruennichi TaxID=94029 RepID=UPI0024946863|nr:ribosome biogenesis protein NOP53-like [Argiope bruennichi]
MGKKVRVSKNRKKNWNKVCDIKDVEEYLEEKRLEERIGGSVFEKTDDQLFVIQTDTKDDVLSKKTGKPLRCFSNIGSYTKVPPPINISQKPYSKKIKNNLTRAVEKRSKRVAKAPQLKKDVPQKVVQKGDLFAAEIRDLWADEGKSVDPEIEDLIKFRDEYTCKRTPKVPEHRYQKPSLLPAVEVPHSGTSYNPDFFDHQDLLREAVKVEESKQKEEMHLKRVLTDMFPSKAEAPTQESILQEMSQGLFEEADPEEDNQTETALLSYNPPVSHENRLPKAKRRRKKEMKEKERLRKLERLQKKRLSEVYRIKSLKSEIKKEAKETQKKVERNLQRRAEKMFKPRTLSKYKYENPDLEVNLSEELGDSLRTLKPEGNLLEDRYKSLQRRNLIEPRIRQKFQRRYKLKVQVKRSHRDFK